jgi:hypothetical protein
MSKRSELSFDRQHRWYCPKCYHFIWVSKWDMHHGAIKCPYCEYENYRYKQNKNLKGDLIV